MCIRDSFTDVARWTIGRMGIAGSDRMERFLRKLLKCYSFEHMRMPLGVVATDVVTGEAIIDVYKRQIWP